VIDSRGHEHKIKDLFTGSENPPDHKLYAIMALDENGKKVYLKPTEFDRKILEKASSQFRELEDELPLPKMSVRQGHNTDQALGYNYLSWRDFFNERQKLCLGLLLQRILRIEDRVVRDHFVCLFSGTLEFNDLFCSFKGEGTGAVRHMFSNHILKPERTPLENSVWGTKGKSSGTFSTLFRSRLLKAKAYLDEPFEISLSSKAGKSFTQKIVCSDPIRVDIADDWEGFMGLDRGALILNGDSASLPIPDCCVDAVVTDPPYFDFVHYSELSDFFYAWVSNALGGEYAYLRRENSSHENEVQDRNVEDFTRKISSIFSECHRVLKDDGLMCFSFHHSRIEGWMAIYESIVGSGFDIVAAHPVKAEMSVAAPKIASKSPINLDAILVCKKEVSPPNFVDPKQAISSLFSDYVARFEEVDRTLSSGDRFVLACSQAVTVASCLRLETVETRELVTWAVASCAQRSDEAG
jgi:putative DNA methylase